MPMDNTLLPLVSLYLGRPIDPIRFHYGSIDPLQHRAMELYCIYQPSKQTSPVVETFQVLCTSRKKGTGWCIPIIGLDASNKIIAQNWNSTGAVGVSGPTLYLETWTHIVSSFSRMNGVRLWVNGTLIGSTGPFGYWPSGVPNTISLGNSPLGPRGCASGNILKGQFYGKIDEFRVYSRELNRSEVSVLFNA